MVPYLGVFFDNRGFDAAEIGFLLAILMATRIVAPNVWALVADRTGMRSELIKLGAFAAALTYLSFFYHGGFLYLALSLALYTFFWNAILAQLEVITLETLGLKPTSMASFAVSAVSAISCWWWAQAGPSRNLAPKCCFMWG